MIKRMAWIVPAVMAATWQYFYTSFCLPGVLQLKQRMAPPQAAKQMVPDNPSVEHTDGATHPV